MRNRISVLFIDSHMKDHDYDEIKYNVRNATEEDGFDMHILPNDDNILTELNKFKGADSIISIGKDLETNNLNRLSFEFRKKWVHLDEFDSSIIVNAIINTFLYNINRTRDANCKLFSVFTCTFNTPKKTFQRLYDSLINQTYNNWNWWILDDSSNPTTSEYIEKLHDPRIVVIKNITNHGNIGFNKHIIAMACDGDFLVEIDHDDEILPTCFEKLLKCFNETNADFVYSDAIEYLEDIDSSIDYGDNFAFGEGIYKNFEMNGKVYKTPVACPYINCKTIRTIYGEPNHIRVWEKNFYHKIGGHNIELSVLDDMDIIIRTFLYGRMAKVDEVLYIQYENGQRGRSSDNTQSKRFKEIQRTVWLLNYKYDKLIHQRILDLGLKDEIWDDETQASQLKKNFDEPLDMYDIKKEEA